MFTKYSVSSLMKKLKWSILNWMYLLKLMFWCPYLIHIAPGKSTLYCCFSFVLHFTDLSSTMEYSMVSFTGHLLFVITGRTLSSLYVLLTSCFNPLTVFLFVSIPYLLLVLFHSLPLFIWLVVGREGYDLSELNKNQSA